MISRVVMGTALLVLGLVAPQGAHADPVVITSGTAFVWWDQSLGSATLSGEEFSIVGSGRGSSPALWRVGEPGNLDGSWNFDSVFSLPGQVTVDGATFSAVLRGGFTATTAPFVVPPIGTVNIFSTPFTATGRVQGFAPGDLSQLLFDVTIIGTGTASVLPNPVSSENLYLNRSGVLFQFAAQELDPVPEPGTLLLVGGGLAVLIRKRFPSSSR
jgi:hypothetical protein